MGEADDELPSEIHQFEVRVDHHQFFIADEDEDPDFMTTPDWYNAGPLVAVGDGCVAIRTGIDMGPVDVDVQSFPAMPIRTEDFDEWETVTEFTLPTDGLLSIHEIMGGRIFGPIVQDRGDYRLRVHAGGRHRAWDQVVDAPLESYLIWIWPTAEPLVELKDGQSNVQVGSHPATPIRAEDSDVRVPLPEVPIPPPPQPMLARGTLPSPPTMPAAVKRADEPGRDDLGMER